MLLRTEFKIAGKFFKIKSEKTTSPWSFKESDYSKINDNNNNKVKLLYIKLESGAGDGSVVRVTGCSIKRSRLNSQRPHGS